MRQSPWLLVFFIGIGIIGLALVGFGVWMLAQSNQLGQALAANVPIDLPAPAENNSMLIITATLDLPSTPEPAPAISNSTPDANSLTPTPTALTPWNACQGSYPSHLRVGYRASVSLDPPLPNNVREQPDKTSKFLFAIQPGDLVDIIGGPSCSGGWVWWQISTSGGKSGWTAEGDGKDYWLIPVK